VDAYESMPAARAVPTFEIHRHIFCASRHLIGDEDVVIDMKVLTCDAATTSVETDWKK
jgi:hypothetical protein